MATTTPDDPEALRQQETAGSSPSPSSASQLSPYDPTADQEHSLYRAGGRHQPGDGASGASPSSSPSTAADQLQQAEANGSRAGANTGAKGAGGQFAGNNFFDENNYSGSMGRFLDRLAHHKKGIAIGSILTGFGVGGTIGLFSLLLPLKITYFVTRLEMKFGATTAAATQKMADNLLNKYVSKYVLPGIKLGNCQSTIEPTCVANVNGNDPVARLYQAWHQKNMETNLAKNYGIVFGKQGGQLYMAVAGEHALTNDDLLKVISGSASIFDVGEVKNISEVRGEIRSAFKKASLWDRVYTRHKVGVFLEKKYGITRCIIACDIRDKFNNLAANKKLFAQAVLVRLVVSPISNELGIFLQCLISPEQSFCSQTLDKIQNLAPGEELDDTALNPFQAHLQADIAESAATYGGDLTNLTKLVTTAKGIASEGLTNYAVRTILTSLFGEGIGELGVKAIPFVGWAVMVASIIHTADNAGPSVRHMSYAIDTIAAVQTYMIYRTVASEMQSGHVDATELGSLADSLGSNITGSASDRSDATSTPLYQSLLASGGTVTNSPYKCNNGSSVPAGQLVCPEEVFTRGNSFLNQVHDIVNIIPGLSGLASIITTISGFFSGIISSVVGILLNGVESGACNFLGSVCTNVSQGIQQQVQRLSAWLFNLLAPSPFSSNMSGGRTFDMMAAGADVSANKSCQVELGCAELNNQQIAQIRNEEAANEQVAFDQLPIFARLFSTTTPFSLVSQLAIAMPTSLSDVATSISTAFANPLAPVAHIFSDLLRGDTAFADSQAINDPFGVIQYGYTDSQVPFDPESYWLQNCQADQVTQWINNQQPDQNTGEPAAMTPQPCLLVQSMVQSTGTLSDPSLAPPGSLNPGPAQ